MKYARPMGNGAMLYRWLASNNQLIYYFSNQRCIVLNTLYLFPKQSKKAPEGILISKMKLSLQKHSLLVSNLRAIIT
jgi:hypothetical protein